MIHPSAIVSPRARIGRGTRIWALAQIREGATIGADCMIGNGVYIDRDVRIGARCNIHNKALLYRNLVVEEEVFIGPGVCFTNDPRPRANRTRNLKGKSTRVGKGCSVGANTIIAADISLGRFALIGAGAYVHDSVPAHGLVMGSPARLVGFVSPAGERLQFMRSSSQGITLSDRKGRFRLRVEPRVYHLLKTKT